MIPVLNPGETGEMASEAVRDLCVRAIAGAPVATYVEAQPMAWSVLGEGGWDVVGASEEDGGGDASLLDLVHVARAWGEFLIPLPLLPSLLAKRWSAAARDHDGPVTLAVGDPASTEAVRVPFASVDGVAVLRSADEGVETVATGAVDGYAPSLLAAAGGELTRATTLTPAQAAELRIIWAAEATGCAERVLSLSVEYAKERQQFAAPIGSFQAIKHHLATMKVSCEAAETAVLRAAFEQSEDAHGPEWAIATALSVIEKGIQVHGGMGFTWELGLHYYLRHVMMLRELVRGVEA